MLKINYLINIALATSNICFYIVFHLNSSKLFDIWFYLLYGILLIIYITVYFMYLTGNLNYFWALIVVFMIQQIIIFLNITFYVSFYIISLYFVLFMITTIFIVTSFFKIIITSMILLMLEIMYLLFEHCGVIDFEKISNF